MTVLPRKPSIFHKIIEPFNNYATESVPAPENDDRFQYGWREEVRELPNGEISYKRTPLTLHDVIHPQEGDFRLHSRFHETTCNYLFNVFSHQLHADPSAVVLFDVRIAWQTLGIEPHTPDISVILGVRDTTKNWSTFDETEEGTKPSLVVEVTSPSTRHVDLTTKFAQYAQVGAAYYVIIDTPKRHTATGRRLLGYKLKGTGYVALQKNGKGWLWIPPVNVWLGLEGTEVHCYDANGQRIDDYSDVLLRAEKAEARAEAEAQAKQELEARLAELEAELRRLRN